MQNGLNMGSKASEIFQFLEQTYFNVDSEYYLNRNFLEDIFSKFKKVNPTDINQLILTTIEKSVGGVDCDLEFLESYFRNLFELNSVSLDLKIKWINKYWESGSSVKYYQYAGLILDQYVALKNFEKLQQAIESILTVNEYWLKPLYASLIAYLEMKNLEKAIEISTKIQDLLLQSWPKLPQKKMTKFEYLEKLFIILSEKVSGELILEKHVLQLKLKLYHHEQLDRYKLVKEEVLKFYILHKDDAQMIAGLLPLIKNQVLAHELKENNRFNLFQIKAIFPLTYEKYKTAIQAQVNKSMEEVEDVDLTLAENNYQVASYEEILKNYPKVETITDFEKQYIQQIKLSDFRETNQVEQLFFAFESMGFLEAAKACLIDKDTDTRQLYLFCEVLLKQEKYLECLFEIDSKIISNILPAKLSLEFKYLKAESLWGIKRKEEAKVMFKEILVENPEFRLVKERIRDA